MAIFTTRVFLGQVKEEIKGRTYAFLSPHVISVWSMAKKPSANNQELHKPSAWGTQCLH